MDFSVTTPEDWEGFKTEIENKCRIKTYSSRTSMYSDPEVLR